MSSMKLDPKLKHCDLLKSKIFFLHVLGLGWSSIPSRASSRKDGGSVAVCSHGPLLGEKQGYSMELLCKDKASSCAAHASHNMLVVKQQKY